MQACHALHFTAQNQLETTDRHRMKRRRRPVLAQERATVIIFHSMKDPPSCNVDADIKLPIRTFFEIRLNLENPEQERLKITIEILRRQKCFFMDREKDYRIIM